VFYDQRSHGRSERAPDDSHAMERLAEDLRDVIAAVVPTGPLVLVGHSMGGMSIMALARVDPVLVAERVFGVAFIATSAGGITDVTLGLPSPVGAVLHRVVPTAAAALAKRKELVELTRRGGADLTLLLTRLYSFGSLATAQAGQFVASMISGTPIDVLAEFFPAIQSHDERSVLPAFRHAEVLVMVGDRDRLTPMEHSVAIVRLLPGAEFLVVDRAGHMVNLEHPSVVDDALLALVARVRRNVDGLAGSHSSGAKRIAR
jgi:pimeloyl-ACP methyl ester carboxylesterase